MPAWLFRNLQLLDPRFDEPRGGYEVLTEDGFIKEVSERPIAATNAQRIDCSGRTLMPPTCSWSTAIRRRTSACSRIRERTCP